jgi:hypothetical protein
MWTKMKIDMNPLGGATYLQWVSRICTSVFWGFSAPLRVQARFFLPRTHGRRGRGHTPNVRRSLQRCAASGDSIMPCALGSNLSRDERKSRGRICIIECVLRPFFPAGVVDSAMGVVPKDVFPTKFDTVETLRARLEKSTYSLKTAMS